MAIVGMKSFQVLDSAKLDMEIFGHTNGSDVYAYINGAGRNGTRVFKGAYYGSMNYPLEDYRFSSYVMDMGGKKEKAFSGMRIYPSYSTRSSPNELRLMNAQDELYFGAKYNSNGVQLPDGTLLPVPDGAYLEIGSDRQYCEIRIDGSVKYRVEKDLGLVNLCLWGNHEFGIPYKSYMVCQDWYVADGEGAVNNTFLGDVQIDALAVTANGTLQNGFTSNESSELFEAVGGLPLSANTFISADSPGAAVSFQAGDISADKKPVAVSLTVSSLKKGIGNYGYNALTILDSVTKEEELEIPPADIRIARQYIFDHAPDGAIWSGAKLNTLEIGVRLDKAAE